MTLNSTCITAYLYMYMQSTHISISSCTISSPSLHHLHNNTRDVFIYSLIRRNLTPFPPLPSSTPHHPTSHHQNKKHLLVNSPCSVLSYCTADCEWVQPETLAIAFPLDHQPYPSYTFYTYFPHTHTIDIFVQINK